MKFIIHLFLLYKSLIQITDFNTADSIITTADPNTVYFNAVVNIIYRNRIFIIF